MASAGGRRLSNWDWESGVKRAAWVGRPYSALIEQMNC